jgi:hypothetical protein
LLRANLLAPSLGPLLGGSTSRVKIKSNAHGFVRLVM